MSMQERMSSLIFGSIFPEKSTSQDLLFLKLIVAAIIALFVGYFLNKLIERAVPYLAKRFTPREHTKKASEHALDTRRTETLLGVATALSRVLVMSACLYIAWRIVNPTATPIALIGASTFFIVLGAATIGPLLRDLTNGTLMIVEKWYNVGDHVVVDPFWELSGVVEQVNLRSTKLRTLSGEVVWIHNQFIQAVRVSPYGVRTLAIDTFVNDLKNGRELINEVLKTMPIGPTMINEKMSIIEEEKLGNVWRITAKGQTTLGREWLIEDFLVKALKQIDKDNELIVHGPIVRYTDSKAEKRFAMSLGENRN